MSRSAGERRAAPPKAAAGAAPTAPPRWPLAVALALLLLRLWTGLFFLDAAKFKLVDQPGEKGLTLGRTFDEFVEKEYVPMVEGAIADPPRAFGEPLTAFADVLRDVALPAKDWLGPMILVAEVLLGVSLVLGIWVRLSAALGFLMMLSFSLAKRVYLFTVSSGNWPITLLLLALSIAAAGRVFGLDRWLRPRLPRWLAWVG